LVLCSSSSSLNRRKSCFTMWFSCVA
jgi:hypothetical protein